MWRKLFIIALIVLVIVLGIGAIPIVNASGSVSGPGDILFTGFNADGDDDLAFVLLGDTTAGQVIYFSDNEWNGNDVGSGGAFIDANEGYLVWTSPATPLAAGTVVQLYDVGSTTPSASLGTVSRSGSFSIAASNEVIYAYLGTAEDTPTTFLTAFANSGFDNNGTLTGTGLTSGTDAINFATVVNDVDIAAYNGSRNNQTTVAAYKTQIMNISSNWVYQDGVGDQSADGIPPDVPFDLTPFTGPNAIQFAGMRASTDPSPALLVTWLLGFMALLGGGFWLRRLSARIHHAKASMSTREEA